MKKRNLNIQGMRGICALMVFGGHATGAFIIPWLQAPHNPFRIILDGHAAVIFFFMLSGYFYYTNDILSIKSYVKMVFKRIIHLIPSYWVSLIIGTILCNIFLSYNIHFGEYVSDWMKEFWLEPVTISRFLNEAKIVFRHGESASFINPPSWYLNADFKAMIIIPTVIWFLNKTRWILAPLFFIVFIKYMENSWFLGIFLMGAILHKLQDKVNRLYELKRWSVYAIFIIGFILWQAQTLFYSPNSQSVNELCFMEMIEAIGVMMLLSILFKLPDLPILASKPLVFMGKISYEFYIIHFMVLLGLLPFISNIWIYLPMCFIISLFFSFILNIGGKLLSNRIIRYF